MRLTTELWAAIEPIYAAILRHPFVRGLTDGTLPRESFEFYAIQDALYLREFARAQAVDRQRFPLPVPVTSFRRPAAGMRALVAMTRARYGR